jgi:histidinol-phosphate aminotransferase
MEPNPHLLDIVRASEDMRGRGRFVRLDRNERMTPFSDSEFRAMLATLQPDTFSAYPDPSPLIDRLAVQLGLPADCISLTNGSDAAIRKLFHTFVRPRDAVLLADPTYAMYPIYAEMFGAVIDRVPYRSDRTLDVGAFCRRLSSHPRIVAIACPDQPTGAVLPLEDLREIVVAAKRNGALCIVDEAYYPFHPVTAIGLAREFDNVAITRTFSKIGGLAGLRLGYFVAQPEIGRMVDRVRGSFEVNAVAIQAGCFVVDHPEIGERCMRELEAGRAVLATVAADLGFGFPPSPANFQLLELPPTLDPRAVVASLEELGYLVKGGFGHPSVERCVRVTLAGPEILRPFADTLREVCARARV